MTDSSKRDFVELLLNASSNASDPGAAAAFSTKFKDLIPQVAIAMWQLGLIGDVSVHPDEIETCDLCGADVDDVFVEGDTLMGEWANMCQDCYSSQGKGIGWGIGALYVKSGEDFLCISGGNPHPEFEEGEDAPEE